MTLLMPQRTTFPAQPYMLPFASTGPYQKPLNSAFRFNQSAKHTLSADAVHFASLQHDEMEKTEEAKNIIDNRLTAFSEAASVERPFTGEIVAINRSSLETLGRHINLEVCAWSDDIVKREKAETIDPGAQARYGSLVKGILFPLGEPDAEGMSKYVQFSIGGGFTLISAKRKSTRRDQDYLTDVSYVSFYTSPLSQWLFRSQTIPWGYVKDDGFDDRGQQLGRILRDKLKAQFKPAS